MPTNGSADGKYTIKVKAVDKSGEITEEIYTFTYDTLVPTVTSIVPEDKSTLMVAPTQIVVKVNDGLGSGIDFASSKASMKLKINTKEITNILRQDNGLDTMTFGLPELEDKGRYNIELTLKDKAGNAYTYTFRFDLIDEGTTLMPEIVSVDPADGSYKNALTQVTAVLKDNSGKGLNLVLSTVTLENPDGIVVPGIKKDNKNDTIIWELSSPLPTDGSADGVYTIKVKAVDKTGDSTEESYSFTYDTLVPTVTSIIPVDKSTLTVAPAQIVIKVSDGEGSGIDFASSKASMKLKVGSIDIVIILRQDNGLDTMTFSLPELEIGKYSIEITLKDKAGNSYTYTSRFDLVEKASDVLPEVVSVEPADRAFKNSVTQVKVVLKDNSGKGLNLEASVITLENPIGVKVDGIQTDDGQQTIIFGLTNALPADGSADGEYVIKVKAVDKTGKVGEYSYSFHYDTVPPKVDSTIPAANDSFYEGITQVTVKLSDSGSGIDFVGTVVNLQGPKGAVQSAKTDNGKDTINLNFAKLTDTGNYVINITPKDKAGNMGYPVQVKFSYVLKPPAVKSVTLTNNSYVKKLDSIEAVLEDRSGIGLDLSENGSSIVVKDPNGIVIQSDQTNNGKDAIIWSPVHPIAIDGTDDGIYTVVVTPVDAIGVSGQSRQYTLIYDTQTPELVTASPININADVTYVSQQLVSVQAKIKDAGPAGIEIKDQKIHLEKADKTLIPGVQTDDAIDTVVWNLNNSLAKDGTADGRYNIVIVAVDKAGNKKEFSYPLVYDTIPPKVTKVSPEDRSAAVSSMTKVSVTLDDPAGSGIDFAKSSIELINPSNAVVSGVLSNDGVSVINLTIAPLDQAGVYTVNVTATDKAGNSNKLKTEFIFKTGLPVVVSTTPITRPAERAYSNIQLNRITAVLQETDGGGIDLSPTGCEIKIQGPDGKFLVGTQSNDGQNTLIFTLGRSLAIDGSDDGVYNIMVKTVNAAKLRDDQYREFKFTHDTQQPEVTSISNLDIKAGLSYVSSQITQLEARLKDKGPAGIDIDRSSIRLIDPNGKQVGGSASDNDLDTLKYDFPSGLSVEGRYTVEVSVLDKANNSYILRALFLYSVSVPEVISTTPVTIPAEKAYINTSIKDVRAELKATGSGGIDFSATGSTIKLRGPKGDIPGIQTDDGSKTLIYTLTKPLAADGSDDGVYTIMVTPVNAAKLKGTPINFTFTYDTVTPEVKSSDIAFWYISGSSLGQISAVISDKSPSSGIDWDNIDNSWIKLRNSGGKEVPGIVSADSTKSQVILELDIPLASSGADDGYYTIIVSPIDKAGNKTSPAVQYEFMYDTLPPKVDKAEITLNGKPLLLDPNLDEYPTAINTKGGVTIVAKIKDESIGADLTSSSIKVYAPDNKEVTGSMTQDGKETMSLTTGPLSQEGLYRIEINPVDLDGNGLNSSSETVITEFLFETKKPTATITEPSVAEEESKDKPITLKGTAVDEEGASGNTKIPASGVAKVEIGGIGPGNKELEWITAIDESDANKEAWSNWYLDFLPKESGTYKIRIKVWDKAGNSEIIDTGKKLTFTISLSFMGDAYCWPNPVSNGMAHISFMVNAPDGEDVTVRLYVYDVSGDLVYESENKDVPSQKRTSVEWGCKNRSDDKVATGIYIFRLEAELPNGQLANKVGKPIVVRQ